MMSHAAICPGPVRGRRTIMRTVPGAPATPPVSPHRISPRQERFPRNVAATRAISQIIDLGQLPDRPIEYVNLPLNAGLSLLAQWDNENERRRRVSPIESGENMGNMPFRPEAAAASAAAARLWGAQPAMGVRGTA